LIRIKNTLAYPLVTSYGYYNETSYEFERCTREAMAKDLIAQIYCGTKADIFSSVISTRLKKLRKEFFSSLRIISNTCRHNILSVEL
jgi:hypothetical protein